MSAKACVRPMSGSSATGRPRVVAFFGGAGRPSTMERSLSSFSSMRARQADSSSVSLLDVDPSASSGALPEESASAREEDRPTPILFQNDPDSSNALSAKQHEATE